MVPHGKGLIVTSGTQQMLNNVEKSVYILSNPMKP